MIYSNVEARPVPKMINGKEEYCIILGSENAIRPLILVCDKDIVVRKGMNRNLSIEYFNEKTFKIKKYKESTCYFLLNAKDIYGKNSVRIKITKKEYPHLSILVKGYEKYNVADIGKKADYALIRVPSWYGIIRIKTKKGKWFQNDIYVVKDSKVMKVEVNKLEETLDILGIKEDFILYPDGNFDANYWLVL